MNPYISYEEEKKLFPTTMGTAMQDAYHQQALQQMGQLAGQAGQSQQSFQGINPLALASMLKKGSASNTDFLTGNYTAPSVGINPYSTLGYNIDSTNGFGLK